MPKVRSIAFKANLAREDVAILKFFKKVSADILLWLGFIFLRVSVSELCEKERDSDTIWTGLAFGVPMLPGGGWIVWKLNPKYRQQLESEKQQESDRLNSIFFRWRKEENGQITAFLMAMAAEVSGEADRSYLDRKAKDFYATIDVDDRREYFHLFNP